MRIAILASLLTFAFADMAHAVEPVPVEKIAARKKPWGGNLPTWQSHTRKGFNDGDWNRKCAAGRRLARNNPLKAMLKPPACIRT